MLPTAGTAAALRLAGKRDEIHPNDAVALIYPSREYFEASARRDREIHHNDVIGPLVTEMGLLGIVDLRRQMRESGWQVTDPSLPDVLERETWRAAPTDG
jgi:hypothetical protein